MRKKISAQKYNFLQTIAKNTILARLYNIDCCICQMDQFLTTTKLSLQVRPLLLLQVPKHLPPQNKMNDFISSIVAAG